MDLGAGFCGGVWVCAATHTRAGISRLGINCRIGTRVLAVLPKMRCEAVEETPPGTVGRERARED